MFPGRRGVPRDPAVRDEGHLILFCGSIFRRIVLLAEIVKHLHHVRFVLGFRGESGWTLSENTGGMLLNVTRKAKRVFTGKTLCILRFPPFERFNNGQVIDNRLLNAIVVTNRNLPNAAYVLNQIPRHRNEQLGSTKPNEGLMEIYVRS